MKKVRIEFTIEVDAESWAAEYDGAYAKAEMKEMLTEDARQAIRQYLDNLGIANAG